MSPIQDLKLIYTNPNGTKTFSDGDSILGTVSFTLAKRVTVKRVMVKVKGDASVEWTEGSGDDETSYIARRRYFKLKDNLVSEGCELPKGIHHFKFKLKIPEGDMPPSFKGSHGKIVYMLEAKISRSWRWPSSIQEELNFAPKSSMLHNQVMCPHTGSVRKEVGVFSKGQVRLTATVNRKVCSQGDTLSIVAKVCNFSTKKMRPKFSLQQKIVYRASGFTKTQEQSLFKMVGDMIKANAENTISCRMRIPVDAVPTLHNCDIISVDHYLKVYLDITFAFDPEVIFPLIIVPLRCVTPQPSENVVPCPAKPIEAPSYSDFPPPAFPSAPYPISGAPGAYGYSALDPTQHTAGGSSDLCQQQDTLPSLFNADFPPPPPFAPSLFQQDPPTYSSLFPDLNYTNEFSEPDENSEFKKEK